MGNIISITSSRTMHDIPQPVFAIFGANLRRATPPEGTGQDAPLGPILRLSRDRPKRGGKKGRKKKR
jgi:hypothetical protein